MASARPTCIVIGIGNLDRGDDAAGRVVLRQLRGTLPEGVGIAEHDGEATSLLATLEGADAAILIDACTSSATPGTVRRFDAAAASLPQEAFGMSTHGFGLAEAIELGRVLGQLPPRCIVYAIEAGSVATGAPLSLPVAAVIGNVAERVRDEIDGIIAAGERTDA